MVDVELKETTILEDASIRRHRFIVVEATRTGERVTALR
jgi:hypothetical protein